MTEPFEAKPVPGYPKLFAGSDGVIYSNHSGKLKPRVATPAKKTRYLMVRTQHSCLYVHRTVAMAWHGAPPQGKPYALHKDDDRQNNHPKNLYWGTQLSNASDAASNGRIRLGSRHPNAALHERHIPHILRRRQEGCSYAKIAERYRVDAATILAVCLGRTWSHVRSDIPRLTANPDRTKNKRRAAPDSTPPKR